MLNKEKYKDEIISIMANTGYNFAVINDKINACENTCCGNCLFSGIGGCRYNRIKWMNAEYEDKIGFKDDIIFLLSIEEYEKYKDKIPYMCIWWWLRSKGNYYHRSTFINLGGYVNDNGINVDNSYYAVRPAIKYDKVKYHISTTKENRIIINDFSFIIIDEENKIAIAEVPISFRVFDYDDNDYENSYIRDWLLEWIK